MNKLFIIIMSAAMVAIAALVLFFKPSSQLEDQQKAAIVVGTDQVIKKTDENQLENDLKEQFKGTELFKVISSSDLNQYKIPDYIKEKVVGEGEASYFSFDHEALNNVKEGDQLKFEMLKFGIDREAIVDSIEELEDGAVRWSGHFKGYDEDVQNFTISQVLEDRYAVMKIFTDQGDFISEVKDGIGIVSNSSNQLENDTVELNDH